MLSSDNNVLSEGAAVQKALDPSYIKVDERSLIDQLSFVADYGRLINFYDQDNNKNKHWNEFFLQDPLILLALIAKTEYVGLHERYFLLMEKLRSSAESIQSTQEGKGISALLGQSLKGGPSIARVVDQILEMLFQLINGIDAWLVYLNESTEQYEFKAYVQESVTDSVSVDFWGLLGLQGYLATKNTADKGISPPDYDLCNELQPQWQAADNRNISHYRTLTAAEIIERLARHGESIFSFYITLIEAAKETFVQLEKETVNNPSTTLLIAFLKIMEKQKQQINKITQRHMDFYYKKVLFEEPNSSSPDEVYTFITLAKDVNDYELPVGTRFLAGIYPNKEPVVFASTDAVSLNKAKVSSIFSVNYQKTANLNAKQKNNRYRWSLSSRKDPEVIGFNQRQEVINYPLFGDASGEKLQQGFGFASPQLNLHSGHRVITVTLHFKSVIDSAYLHGSLVYLSSEKSWLAVPAEFSQPSESALVIKLTLDVADPPITALTVSSEYTGADNPILKLVLADTVNLNIADKEIPKLLSIDIDVVVNGYKGLVLANDKATLSAAKPFTPLGIIPELGANFYLGSREIFSKTIDAMQLQFSWSDLPDDFGSYYQPYNDYLKSINEEIYSNESFEVEFSCLSDTGWSPISGVVNQSGKGSLGEISTAPHDVQKESDKETPLTLFLENSNKKKPADKTSEDDQKKEGKDESISQDVVDTLEEVGDGLKHVEEAVLDGVSDVASLAQEVGDPKVKVIGKLIGAVADGLKGDDDKPASTKLLSDDAYFSFSEKIVGDNTLAGLSSEKPLKYPPSRPSGFIKMTLTKPKYGFGNSIYPKVVAGVSLRNAMLISDKKLLKEIVKNEKSDKKKGKKLSGFLAKLSQFLGKKEDSLSKELKLEPVPNKPYTPLLTSISANYQSSCSIDLSNIDNSGDFHFYHNNGFSTSPIVDGESLASDRANGSSAGAQSGFGGLSLFSGIDTVMTAYLMLDKLTAPCNLTLYFELQEEEGSAKSTDSKSLHFNYLSNKGWKPLKVLKDLSNQLHCSGLIEVEIPGDIAIASPQMPAGGAWISVGSNDLSYSDIKVSYINSQAVKLSRVKPFGQDSIAKPLLLAKTISSTEKKTPAIASVDQPFPSFGGVAGENAMTFYNRVSQRIKTKDRCAIGNEYERLAIDNFPDLYYAKLITDANSPADIKVAVVARCNDMSLPGASRPSVDRCKREKILNLLSSKVSPFVRLDVINMKYVAIKVVAQLRFSNASRAVLQCQAMTKDLKLYLSPWVNQGKQSIDIDSGINRSQIIDYLLSFADVESVSALSLYRIEKDKNGVLSEVEQSGDIRLEDSAQLLVCSNESVISSVN